MVLGNFHHVCNTDFFLSLYLFAQVIFIDRNLTHDTPQQMYAFVLVMMLLRV